MREQEVLKGQEESWAILCGVNVIGRKFSGIVYNFSSTANCNYLFCLISSLKLYNNNVPIAVKWWELNGMKNVWYRQVVQLTDANMSYGKKMNKCAGRQILGLFMLLLQETVTSWGCFELCKPLFFRKAIQKELIFPFVKTM